MYLGYGKENLTKPLAIFGIPWVIVHNPWKPDINNKLQCCVSIVLHVVKFITYVESRFLKPPKETKNGSRNREFEISG